MPITPYVCRYTTLRNLKFKIQPFSVTAFTYPTAARKRQVAPERLLQTHLTFSKSVMVSMSVSKLGPMDLIFNDVRVKINGAYYREVILTQ